MARQANPFQPRVVLALLLVGAAALLVLLYAIGAGLDGQRDGDGGSHAASNGLNGFTGLAQLLERRGYDVQLSRAETRLDDEALLILTPPLAADPADLAKMLESRRHIGPTLVILPKWLAMPADPRLLPGAKEDWVTLASAMPADWIGQVAGLDGTMARIAPVAGWRGMGLAGTLPQPESGMGLTGGPIVPLARAGGQTLAGYWQDNGYYPTLRAAAGLPSADTLAEGGDTGKWAVVLVAEPDLMNNYGLADRQRAQLAMALIHAAMEGQGKLPIVFDLTLAGLGRSENLLTLAFEPPFAAATLCLIMVALVIGWRAFHRFGTAAQATAGGAFGKRQLAINGAALVQRTGRWHVPGPPYAAMMERRIGRKLGLRGGGNGGQLFAALERRGMAADYRDQTDRLKTTKNPAELLRVAAALHRIERTISR